MSKRSRSRSGSPRQHKRQRDIDLPHGVSELSEEDYFLKMKEFQRWLKDEKDRYFDELSGDKARHYFRKFVKKWNRGELSDDIYQGRQATSDTQTSYQWSFAKNKSKIDPNALKSIRDDVQAETNGRAQLSNENDASRARSKVQGPSLPSASDMQYVREVADDLKTRSMQASRRHDRTEQRERVDELVGPKESGREGMLEKKRVARESDKSYRDAKDDGALEFNDNDLLGGSDSFKAAILRRDANKRKFEEKKRQEKDSKYVETRERTTQMREKDKATMDMFRAMAKDRFG